MKVVHTLAICGIGLGLLLFLPELIHGGGATNAAYGMGGFMLIAFSVAGWVVLVVLVALLTAMNDAVVRKMKDSD